ncbi:MAG: tetratricopeptide repeat protein [Phycisphaerales bacterium]|nr:tetratricopeptide repeat protein [Planctomycetota bacterium]
MNNPEHLYHKAFEAASQGNYELALVFLGELLSRHPAIAKAHHLSATCCMRMGDFQRALQHARSAVEYAPDHPPSRWVLGICLAQTDQHDLAIEEFKMGCGLAPQEADGWNNLGHALLEKRRFEEAEAALRRGLSITNKMPNLSVGLAWCLVQTGRADEALAVLAAQDASTPRELAVLYARTVMSLYSEKVNAAALAQLHREYASRVESQLPARPIRPSSPGPADAERPLRVGLLSPDMYGHSVSRFVEPLLLHSDRDKIRFGVFSTNPMRDEITGRLDSMAGLWSEIFRLPDQMAVTEIRNQQLDIMIDLAGHMPMNRSYLLHHRPAVITMSYIGYPHRTGYSGIDYRIVDSITDPPAEADNSSSEKLLRLDPCFLCFMPAVEPPPIEPIDPAGSGPLTFGSYNNVAKFSPGLLDLWARILKQTPGSRLRLKGFAFSDASTRNHIAREFGRREIEPERVEMMGMIPVTREHLASYGGVHVALDTYPYHGTTTTCEALLMGVPVVTLAGSEHRSRVGVSLLTAVGTPELIAANPDEYVKIAVELAKDRAKIAHYRDTLRARITSSPLMDGPGFCARFENPLRGVWRQACGANP